MKFVSKDCNVQNLCIKPCSLGSRFPNIGYGSEGRVYKYDEDTWVNLKPVAKKLKGQVGPNGRPLAQINGQIAIEPKKSRFGTNEIHFNPHTVHEYDAISEEYAKYAWLHKNNNIVIDDMEEISKSPSEIYDEYWPWAYEEDDE